MRRSRRRRLRRINDSWNLSRLLLAPGRGRWRTDRRRHLPERFPVGVRHLDVLESIGGITGNQPHSPLQEVVVVGFKVYNLLLPIIVERAHDMVAANTDASAIPFVVGEEEFVLAESFLPIHEGSKLTNPRFLASGVPEPELESVPVAEGLAEEQHYAGAFFFPPQIDGEVIVGPTKVAEQYPVPVVTRRVGPHQFPPLDEPTPRRDFHHPPQRQCRVDRLNVRRLTRAGPGPIGLIVLGVHDDCRMGFGIAILDRRRCRRRRRAPSIDGRRWRLGVV